MLRKGLTNYKSCRNRFFYIKLIKITRRAILWSLDINIERIFYYLLNNEYI